MQARPHSEIYIVRLRIMVKADGFIKRRGYGSFFTVVSNTATIETQVNQAIIDYPTTISAEEVGTSQYCRLSNQL
jgi:hypothetical protein